MISKSTLRSVATGLFVLLAALLAANLPAHGASGPWQRTDIVEGRLIAAVEGMGEGTNTLDRVPLGLHLKMKPGWKTYWRSPGDAGLPPQLSWEGSGNLAGTDFRWPAPHRFTLFGIETFGYDREVVFPITAKPDQAGQPLDLKASVDLLVCSEICVPQHLDLDSRRAGRAGGAERRRRQPARAVYVVRSGRRRGIRAWDRERTDLRQGSGGRRHGARTVRRS